MDRTKFGLQDTKKTGYFPVEEQKLLVNASNIRQTLGPVSNHCINWIKAEAPKTFIITVLAISELKRAAAMHTFYARNFTDTNLPVKTLPSGCKFAWDSSERTACDDHYCQNSVRDCAGIHKRVLDCFHHRVWSTRAFARFCEEQWHLLHPKFDSKEIQCLELEEERILPFLPSENPNRDGQGHFAIVQPARIPSEFMLNTKCVRLHAAFPNFD
jgi:hypothetical protein